MNNCPTCGKEFETSRAMKIHHKQSHGESIAIEQTSCNNCGNIFEYYPSNKPGLYCKSCVENGISNNIEYIPEESKHKFKSGDDNINYSGGEYRKCDWCNEQVYVSPSHIKDRAHQFCSDKCYRNWQSKNYRGEGNPFWKGGYNPNYSKGWWSARRKTLERDNYTCQICGATESSNGRNCDVHHKKPVRTFDSPSDSHFLDNLVTLCRSCHSSVEMGDRKI